MFTMIIGEEGEYGRRLRKYLETHWTGSLRLHSFTKPETLRASEEEADCYLLEEGFFHSMQEEGELPPDFPARCILISGEEREDCFCRYHPPDELIRMIEKRRALLEAAGGRGGGMVTALYSPVFEPELERIAAAGMKPGDLYLGMEDVGDPRSENRNMGDLCYFIGLRSKDMAAMVKEAAREEDGIWRVDSPGLYLDLLELMPEEYQWFFQCLKESGEYGDIYVGLGSGIFSHLPLNILFDRLLIIDSRSHRRQHFACSCLERAMQSESRRFHGICERRYREEIVDAAAQ